MNLSHFACRSLPRSLALALLVSTLLASSSVSGQWKLDQMVGNDSSGMPIYRPLPVDAKFTNPISEADEQQFQARAREIIALQGAQKVSAGNTYFENEKRTYGYLMAQVLAGSEKAISDLQMEDGQAKEWHRETSGIDFYAAFTLKHQTRKFFYFGDLLAPEYRARMLAGAKSWTAEDPLRRPHYAFKQPGEGWGPNVKNSWVDVRSTENLYLMRVTSVYLFAEAAGNAKVRDQYKSEIRRYVSSLYRVGMGEWDSENYHGHSIGPLCNLYDFAKDEEVKLLAKASLDWIFAAGAVKYYRGAFCGPTKRDYNHVQPFGGSAANMLWIHFGDCPIANTHWESDEVHLITSGYRPPPAVIKLARKEFEKPVDLFATKPSYSATTSGDTKSPPEYLETMHLGHSFLMGSLASGSSVDGGDVNGFKIVVDDRSRGGVAIQGCPGPDPGFVGSPQYQNGKSAGPNRVAQDGNIAIWIVKSGTAPWTWVLPKSIKVSSERGITFLEADKTWIAMQPLGTGEIKVSPSLTEQISSGDKPKFPEHQVLSATGNAETFCGVAIEVGEKQSHGSFEKFKKEVLEAEVDSSKLASGVVQYKSASGKFLGFHWNDNAADLGVWKNGKRHDWAKHAASLYQTAEATEITGPIDARWNDGALYVEAGESGFYCKVGEDGKVVFYNGKPAEVKSKIVSP